MLDLQFPSGELDIPTLLLERQPAGLDLPLVGWGTLKRSSKNRGTYHFYVDDYRFRTVWDDPKKLLDTGVCGVIEPNFSIYHQTPYPVALNAIYQKRWLARYWQSQGVNVWVDLNVAEEYSLLNLQGVPRGWRAYATRGQTDYLDDVEREYERAREHCGSQPLFLVYGGGRYVADFCKAREHLGYLHSQEYRTWLREQRRSKSSRQLQLVGLAEAAE